MLQDKLNMARSGAAVMSTIPWFTRRYRRWSVIPHAQYAQLMASINIVLLIANQIYEFRHNLQRQKFYLPFMLSNYRHLGLAVRSWDFFLGNSATGICGSCDNDVHVINSRKSKQGRIFVSFELTRLASRSAKNPRFAREHRRARKLPFAFSTPFPDKRGLDTGKVWEVKL